MTWIPLDLRFAFRQLVRQPSLTCLIVGTMAVGIAIGTTAFSLVNSAFLRPLATANAGELVNLYTTRSDRAGHGALSYPDYLDVRAASASQFSGVLGYSGLLATWSHDGQADALFGEIVTGSYFPTLGIQPTLGRLLTADDDRFPGQHAVVVIGHRFWSRQLAADPDVVGRSLVLNGRTYTVVGVAPKSFGGLLFRGFAVDVWAPSMMMGQLRTDQLANRNERWMFVRARLTPEATTDSVNATLQTTAANLERAYPESNTGHTFTAVPSSRVWLSPDADRPLMVIAVLLVGACLLALAVGLSNIMALLVARMMGRSRELAVHAALGATRGRMFRQLLMEAMLLAGAGGALALVLSGAAARMLSAYRPPLPVPITLDVVIDQRVVLFAASLTFVAAALIALAQLRRLQGADLSGSLRSRASGLDRGRSKRHWLLVPQIAGSVVLLVLAALLTRSVTNAAAVDRGFDDGPIGMLTVNAATSELDEAEARQFLERLVEYARAIPGVTATSIADRIPLDLYGSRTVSATIGDEATVGVHAATVTDDYFAVLGIPLRAGRVFDGRDLADEPHTVIVNDTFARLHWPASSPIGRVVSIGDRPHEVIGVVGDVKVQTLGEPPTEMIYQPLTSGYGDVLRVMVRTSASPIAVLDSLEAYATAIRPEVAVVERRTMSEHAALMLLPFQTASALAGALGVLAVLLAAVGLHGLVAFTVASRTREFGVRLAIGATPARLVRAGLADTARAMVVGLTAGLVVAGLATRGLAGFVFGVSPLDPVAFAGVALLVTGVAVAAAVGPARQVARMDPLAALRSE